MTILHITTNYSGGAGTACRRLAEAQIKAGLDAHVLVLQKPIEQVPAYVHNLEQILSDRYGNIVFKFLLRLNQLRNKWPTILHPEGYINPPWSLFRLEQLDLFKRADIIHLHWVPKVLNHRSVFAQKSKLFVWTMHDMLPFSGGYHYLTGSERFLGLVRDWETQVAAWLQGNNIRFVSPSQWLADVCKASLVGRTHPVSVIPNTLDLDVFTPGDRAQALKTLNIEETEKQSILFVAENVADQRKGYQLLLEALDAIQEKDKVRLLVLGKPANSHVAGIETIWLGYQTLEEKIVAAYRAADVFVIPSVEDNLPNTILESLACDTPVVGFCVGGIPDLVKDGLTGVCVESNLPKALTKGLLTVLNNQEQYKGNCRAMAEKKVSSSIVTDQYLSIYNDLLHAVH